MNVLTESASYLRDVVTELKRVSFPTRLQVVQRTLIVIVSIVAATGIIALIDAGITWVFRLFIFK